jgi:hypothetical protein
MLVIMGSGDAFRVGPVQRGIQFLKADPTAPGRLIR